MKAIKKLFVAAALMLGAGAFSASAVSPFVEFQPIQVGDSWTAFNVQAGVTVPVHSMVNVGVGAGITEKWNFNHAPLIPIFARGELNFPVSKFKPFVSMDLGYEINTDDTHYGAVLVNPMVGLKFSNWYVGLGYLGHCWTPKHAGSTNTFNMKVGYTF